MLNYHKNKTTRRQQLSLVPILNLSSAV